MDWKGNHEPVLGRDGIFVQEISAAEALTLSEYSDDTEATLELIRLAAVDQDGAQLFNSHDHIKALLSLPAIKAVGEAALALNALTEDTAGND